MDFDTGRCVYECGARSESSYFSENSGEGETVWSHSDSETTSGETTSSDSSGQLDAGNPADITSPTGKVTVQVVDVSTGGYEEARSEGLLGNQPEPLAKGNYAHQVLGSGPSRAISPGNFPDQWDTKGFTEIKPYHEGIDPLTEFKSQLDRYSQAFYIRFEYAPSVNLILYRYV